MPTPTPTPNQERYYETHGEPLFSSRAGPCKSAATVQPPPYLLAARHRPQGWGQGRVRVREGSEPYPIVAGRQWPVAQPLPVGRLVLRCEASRQWPRVAPPHPQPRPEPGT